MTARCGSTSPAHRAQGCPGCRKVYNQRRLGLRPKFKKRFLAIAARCAFCGLADGNTMGVRVCRYTLRKNGVKVDGKRTSTALGSIGICDRCVIEQGLIHAKYIDMIGAAA